MNPEVLEEYPMRERPWAALACIRVFSDFMEGMNPKIRERSPIRFPVGFVFVRSTRFFGEQALYKFPGGRENEADSTPLDIALRETEEETGIVIPRNRMKYALSTSVRKKANRDARSPDFSGASGRQRHTLHFFYADLYEYEARKMHNFHPDNGGEDPELLTFAKLQDATDAGLVMSTHLDLGREAGLLLFPLRTAA